MIKGATAKVVDVAKVSTGEAATEGFQTLVEEKLSSLNYDIEGKKIFTAAAIGGGVGGGASLVGTVPKTAKATAKVVGEQVSAHKERTEKLNAEKAAKEAKDKDVVNVSANVVKAEPKEVTPES